MILTVADDALTRRIYYCLARYDGRQTRQGVRLPMIRVCTKSNFRSLPLSLALSPVLFLPTTLSSCSSLGMEARLCLPLSLFSSQSLPIEHYSSRRFTAVLPSPRPKSPLNLNLLRLASSPPDWGGPVGIDAPRRASEETPGLFIVGLHFSNIGPLAGPTTHDLHFSTEMDGSEQIRHRGPGCLEPQRRCKRHRGVDIGHGTGSGKEKDSRSRQLNGSDSAGTRLSPVL